MTDTEIPALKPWPFGRFSDDDIAAVAAFLKERDESVLPEEADDEEREGSALYILNLLAERRRHPAVAQPVASARDALQAIANLPTGRTLEVTEGHEGAYRAVEKMFHTPPVIYAAPTPPSRAEVTPEMVGWTSVEDSLPGEQGCDSDDVLVFLNGHCSLTDMECRQGGGWGIRIGYYDAGKHFFRAGGICPEVTHWMPLPAAPALGAGKEGE